MFRINGEIEFEAAHKLSKYKGKCNRTHGHNWVVQFVYVGDTLDDIGILVDFKQVKEVAYTIYKEFDHFYLNNKIGFEPTAENLAKYIFNKMKVFKLGKNARLEKVRVYENWRHNAWAEYEGTGD